MEENQAAPADQPAAPSASEPARAGFWVRGGALAVDTLILGLCFFLPIHGLGYLVGFVYKVIFTSQGGQTPGKMAAGIKVVTVDGRPVSVGRAIGRTLAEWLSAMVVMIGYFVAGLSDKRALHDYIAGTRVVYVEGVGAGRKAAFACLGVLAVFMFIGSIGALSLGAVGGFGKFKSLKVKSGEGATKGNLGALRSAASIYYGDTEGSYPATLDALVDPKYVPSMPKTKVADHPETDAVTLYGAEVCTGKTEYGSEIDASKLKDTGGWGYVADPKAVCWGQVFVDCTHQDSKGKRWPEY
ncbi:MAG: RDD family protein [Elusimicrobia bacterium]|nr:RDD family protein [Elusimicrobiota bacterium]